MNPGYSTGPALRRAS